MVEEGSGRSLMAQTSGNSSAQEGSGLGLCSGGWFRCSPLDPTGSGRAWRLLCADGSAPNQEEIAAACSDNSRVLE